MTVLSPHSVPPAPVTHDLWQRAAVAAACWHASQYRKDGRTPYVSHPYRVALFLASTLGVSDPEILAAALLHDVIEDTDADYEDLSEPFGARVADLVAAVSKDARRPAALREAAFHRQLAEAPWEARLLKLADVYDNLCDAPEGPLRDRLHRRAAWTVALAEGDPRLTAAADAVRTRLAGDDTRGPGTEPT